MADGVVPVLADVAQDAIDDFGGAELGAEDAANEVVGRGRQLAIVERRVPEYRCARLLGALDYTHCR